MGRRRDSQRPRPTSAMVRQCLFGKLIQSAGFRIGLDLPIPHILPKRFEPGSKRLQFFRAQFRNGFFNLLKLGHGRMIPLLG